MYRNAINILKETAANPIFGNPCLFEYDDVIDVAFDLADETLEFVLPRVRFDDEFPLESALAAVLTGNKDKIVKPQVIKIVQLLMADPREPQSIGLTEAGYRAYYGTLDFDRNALDEGCSWWSVDKFGHTAMDEAVAGVVFIQLSWLYGSQR